MNKSWYESKTKWGAVLIGLGAILGTVGGYFSGSLDIQGALQALLIEAGGVLGIFGIRDLPFVNK